MTARFALRWTLIGLLAVVPLVAIAFLLSLQPRTPPLSQRSVSVDELLSAVEMPLDANGYGTQIISNTTLLLRLQPYPVRASTICTVTLVALTADKLAYRNANPSLQVTGATQDSIREYPLPLRDDGSYVLSQVLFQSPGLYRLRLDVYLGDAAPANMIFSVAAGEPAAK